MRLSYWKPSKAVKISVFIVLSSILMISLYGFRDIKREGVECKFQARIVDIEKPPPDKKVLVVKETPVTKAKSKGKQQKIYVIVTKETIIGFESNTMKFDDLRIEMSIWIEGFKIVEKEDGEEIVVIQAKRIRPMLE